MEPTTKAEARQQFLAKVAAFNRAGYDLLEAWDKNSQVLIDGHFNADDEFGPPVDSQGAPLFTHSLDEWLLELATFYMDADGKITYSIVHHQSGEAYIAEFKGSDVARAVETHARAIATITPNEARAYLDNQPGEDLEATANDLNAWLEARDAWIVRSPLDPNIR